MAVWYLDTDDEITDAVARLRQADDEHVVFVVPPGSRIATGRINFKLLEREARSRARRLAIASPDEQVRAMAAAAGVVTAPTADDAEAALQRGDEPAAVDEPGPVPAAVAVTATDEETPARTGRLAWGSQRLRLATLAVLVVAVVGIYVAWQTMPTADISLTPRTAALGPLEMSLVALPSVAEPEPEAGRIPAVVVSVPLEVEDDFESTVETVEARAGGEVVFSSPEQPIEPVIPARTRVRTPSGIEFQTTAAVTLPPGSPSQVTAPVEAIRPGEEGNVDAGAISLAPSLDARGISVSNPAPTNGGRFEQSRRVTADDYDAAAAELQNRLFGALETLPDPAAVPPELTVYPKSARLGPVDYSPSFEELVGSREATFALRASAVARVLAVDERDVEEVARLRLLAAVPEGRRSVGDSIEVSHGEGRPEEQRIHFEAVATGLTYELIDSEALREQVAGLPISDARAILDAYGPATVNVWPEFLGDLPSDRNRITLDVIEPSTTE